MNSLPVNRFTKLLSPKYFRELLQEARRVKYHVVGKPKDFYEVRDDETQDLVFKGIFQGRFWIVTFSSLYWLDP